MKIFIFFTLLIYTSFVSVNAQTTLEDNTYYIDINSNRTSLEGTGCHYEELVSYTDKIVTTSNTFTVNYDFISGIGTADGNNCDYSGINRNNGRSSFNIEISRTADELSGEITKNITPDGSFYLTIEWNYCEESSPIIKN